MLNVIKSVTRNFRSIALTALLAVILIYLFSILGFLFFQDDFLMEIEPVTTAEKSGKAHRNRTTIKSRGNWLRYIEIEPVTIITKSGKIYKNKRNSGKIYRNRISHISREM